MLPRKSLCSDESVWPSRWMYQTENETPFHAQAACDGCLDNHHSDVRETTNHSHHGNPPLGPTYIYKTFVIIINKYTDNAFRYLSIKMFLVSLIVSPAPALLVPPDWCQEGVPYTLPPLNWSGPHEGPKDLSICSFSPYSFSPGVVIVTWCPLTCLDVLVSSLVDVSTISIPLTSYVGPSIVPCTFPTTQLSHEITSPRTDTALALLRTWTPGCRIGRDSLTAMLHSIDQDSYTTHITLSSIFHTHTHSGTPLTNCIFIITCVCIANVFFCIMHLYIWVCRSTPCILGAR